MEMKKGKIWWDRGSNSRKRYPENVVTRYQRFSSESILSRVKQSIDKVWRRDGRYSEPSMTKYLAAHTESPVSNRGNKNGWLNYFAHRTLRASASTGSDDKSVQRTRQSRTILRTHFCGREQIKTLPAKDRRPHVRFLGIRRSISLPGDEMERSRFNLRRSMSSKEVMNKSRQELKTSSSGFRTQEERIVEQTKDFCRDIIVQKLKRNKLINRVEFNRPPTCEQWIIRDVQIICNELERRNSTLCKNLSKQIGVTLRSEEVLRKVFFEFALEIITTHASNCEKRNRSHPEPRRTQSEEVDSCDKTLEITWGRIMAILIAASAFAIDCINQGHSELVGELIEFCGEFFLGEGVVDWLMAQGGWETLCEINSTRIKDTDPTNAWNIFLISACVFVSLVIWVGISNLTIDGV